MKNFAEINRALAAKKKLILCLASLVLMMPANAQFFNRLVDKARESAERSIDKNAEKQQPVVEQQQEDQEEDTWRHSQGMMPNDANFMSRLEGVKAAPTPKTIAAAIKALPAVPSVDQVITPEAKEKVWRATYQPYEMAVDNGIMWNSNEAVSIDNRIKAAGQKQSQKNKNAMAQYQSNVNAGLMPSQQEMMALYTSGEINEKMSEAQMMDVMAGKFAAKWGVSKEEYLKIINLAQKNEKQAEAYLKSNHPDLYNRLYAANASYGNSNVQADDSRDARFEQISEELHNLQEQLNNAIASYGGNRQYTGAHPGQSELDILNEQMLKEWNNSPEAKQFDAIAAALDKRVDAWITTLPNDLYEAPYPDWWTAERKKLNALIDQWNRRWATKWVKIAQDGDNSMRPILERVAVLEAENEKLGQQGGTENLLYLENKKVISVFYAYLPQLRLPYNQALSFPCIERLEETGSVPLGKG